MSSVYADTQALPTTFQGVTFRSRLEARWAIFFDGIALQWMYEPEGYRLPSGRNYLPDFFLPELRFHAEVKPTKEAWEEEVEKLLEFDDNPPPNSRGLIQLIGTPGPPLFDEVGLPVTATAKVCLWARGQICRSLLKVADRAWRQAASARFGT